MKDKLVTGTLVNYFTTRKYIPMFLKEKYRTSDMYRKELSYTFTRTLNFSFVTIHSIIITGLYTTMG